MRFSFVFVVSAFALAGCTASSTEEQDAETSTAALSNTGGSGVRPYDCAGGFCTCTGDADCNDMFSDGVCGERAICQISPTDVPRCRCSAALTGTGGRGGRRFPAERATGGVSLGVR